MHFGVLSLVLTPHFSRFQIISSANFTFRIFERYATSINNAFNMKHSEIQMKTSIISFWIWMMHFFNLRIMRTPFSLHRRNLQVYGSIRNCKFYKGKITSYKYKYKYKSKTCNTSYKFVVQVDFLVLQESQTVRKQRNSVYFYL